MPELPEVETIKRGIEKTCLKKKIVDAKVYTAKLRYDIAPSLPDIIKNQTITNIIRRGKYLILSLTNGSLIFHFGMTGKIIMQNKYEKLTHEHLAIFLNVGLIMSFCDPRKFGAIIWTQNNWHHHVCIQNVGVEPLSDEFNSNYLHNLCHEKITTIKQLLMSNKLIAGVGNIYANEALYQSQILPYRKAKTLTLSECTKLCAAIKSVLKKAIAAGGTTIKDFCNHQGELGYFKHQLKVYGKAKQLCHKCKHEIKKITISKRSSYYCPYCQGNVEGSVNIR